MPVARRRAEPCASVSSTPPLAAARAVGYTSCGTVEFLLAPDGAFYFLEMNTRLQVEHPVTEEVWGVDLAAEMIRIALGEPLPFDAASLAPRGHAIECRIYAEDPRRGFAPSPGLIAALRLPQGPGVRNDVGVEAGSVVPIDYDPMLGKLIVHGADRAQAIARLARALADYEIAGVETTLPLFRRARRAIPSSVRGRLRRAVARPPAGRGLFPADRAGSGRGAGWRRRGSRPPRSPSRPPQRDRRHRSGAARRAAKRCGAERMRHLKLILREDGEPPEEIAVEIDGARYALTRGGATRVAEVARLPDGRLSLVLEDGRQICGRVRPGGDGEVEVDDGRGPATRRARRAAPGPHRPCGRVRRRDGRRRDPGADAGPRRRGRRRGGRPWSRRARCSSSSRR